MAWHLSHMMTMWGKKGRRYTPAKLLGRAAPIDHSQQDKFAAVWARVVAQGRADASAPGTLPIPGVLPFPLPEGPADFPDDR